MEFPYLIDSIAQGYYDFDGVFKSIVSRGGRAGGADGFGRAGTSAGLEQQINENAMNGAACGRAGMATPFSFNPTRDAKRAAKSAKHAGSLHGEELKEYAKLNAAEDKITKKIEKELKASGERRSRSAVRN